MSENKLIWAATLGFVIGMAVAGTSHYFGTLPADPGVRYLVSLLGAATVVSAIALVEIRGDDDD